MRTYNVEPQQCVLAGLKSSRAPLYCGLHECWHGSFALWAGGAEEPARGKSPTGASAHYPSTQGLVTRKAKGEAVVKRPRPNAPAGKSGDKVCDARAG